MPKLKGKLVKAAVQTLIAKPKHTNYRHEGLQSFVTEDQYAAIRNAVGGLLHLGLEITLRRIWASVDHMVSVNDGRETEVYLAEAAQHAEEIREASRVKPGAKGSGKSVR